MVKIIPSQTVPLQGVPIFSSQRLVPPHLVGFLSPNGPSAMSRPSPSGPPSGFWLQGHGSTNRMQWNTLKAQRQKRLARLLSAPSPPASPHRIGTGFAAAEVARAAARAGVRRRLELAVRFVAPVGAGAELRRQGLPRLEVIACSQ